MVSSVLLLTSFFALLPLAHSDCFNSIADGHETDVDCGGSDCWQRCGIGQQCKKGHDCYSGRCLHNSCHNSNFRTLTSEATGSGPSVIHNQSHPVYIKLPYDDVNRAISIIALLVSFLSFVIACKIGDLLCRPRQRHYTLNSNGEITVVDERSGEMTRLNGNIEEENNDAEGSI